MSGFAGIISLDGVMPDAQLLKRMTHTLAFRGPDNTHIKTMPGAGFCFTFLRTGPAPQCPSQPCSLDGNVWLLGDVRLDGRDDLRRKLEQHGDEIAADVTDEELVLRAWRRWREDTFPDLIGDYSFALWDAQARQLRCVRDLMGARPFFYAQAANHLYFSNTLNAIRCARDISSALDEHFIGDFLLQGWCSYPERTAFHSISRLPAGHLLRFSPDGLEVRRYISLPIEEPLWLKREEEYVERFRDLLKTAVRERVPAGPVAIFMSGGLDSTSVAAVALSIAKDHALPLDLRAYTLDYQPLFDDQEGSLASVAAQFIGIDIEVHHGSSHLPYEGWELSLPPMPEPFHEPFQSMYVTLNRSVARHSRVALNGFGGDGVLTGQTWPYLLDLARRLKFGMILRTFGGYILSHRRIPPLRAGLRTKLRRLTKSAESITEYPTWLAPEFEYRLRLRARWIELHRPTANLHRWHAKAYALLNGSYWPCVQESEDASRLGAAIEARAPFLDVRLQRFLLRLPPVPLCINKELIRRATHGLLPDAIRSRAKVPFAGDQVALHISANHWSPMPLPVFPQMLQQFVSVERLHSLLATALIRFPWLNLRPIALLYWLRWIEFEGSIGYS